jgi:hypothetical protein
MINLMFKTLLTICLLIVTVVCGELPRYPLCSTAKGFASDTNSEFLLSVGKDSIRKGESVVLAIRPVPYIIGQTWIAARLNATYKVLGVDIFANSDEFGILQITDEIEKDTDIQVKITNLRSDGATPFVFYSYQSRYRTCSLDISPSTSFSGPVPTHVPDTDTEAYVYFKAVPQPGATAFKIVATGSISISYSETDDGAGNVISTNTPIPIGTTATVMYFTLRPNSRVSNTQMVHVAISYITSPTSPATATPPTDNGVGAPVPPTPNNNGAPVPATAGKEAAQASGGILSVLIVLVMVYFASRSIYNYRVKKITDFPEFVPHHEVFSGVAALCGTAAKHMRDKGRSTMNARGGYNDVNRDEMYEAS